VVALGYLLAPGVLEARIYALLYVILKKKSEKKTQV
jgi:hypothetical protein